MLAWDLKDPGSSPSSATDFPCSPGCLTLSLPFFPIHIMGEMALPNFAGVQGDMGLVLGTLVIQHIKAVKPTHRLCSVTRSFNSGWLGNLAALSAPQVFGRLGGQQQHLPCGPSPGLRDGASSSMQAHTSRGKHSSSPGRVLWQEGRTQPRSLRTCSTGQELPSLLPASARLICSCSDSVTAFPPSPPPPPCITNAMLFQSLFPSLHTRPYPLLPPTSLESTIPYSNPPPKTPKIWHVLWPHTGEDKDPPEKPTDRTLNGNSEGSDVQSPHLGYTKQRLRSLLSPVHADSEPFAHTNAIPRTTCLFPANPKGHPGP